MHDPAVDPGRLALLDELRLAAVATYGEERVAEQPVQMALAAAATAVWRVSLEQLEPSGPEPLRTHA